MKDHQKATHATRLSGPPGQDRTQWVQVFPKGVFSGRDGRGPYRCDPAKVIAATAVHFGGADVPTDYDHQLDHATKNGRPAPASGWVKEFAARDDGLWALVEWTPKAAAHIADREYRYVSPSFFHNKSGDIRLLESISLTNLPNLEIKAIASSEGVNEEFDMSLKALCAVFGLPENATDEQVLAHAKRITAEYALEKEAAAKAGAEIEGLQKALAAKETEQPDPAKYAPLSAVQALRAELAEVKSTAMRERADALAAEGVKAGKISPAMAEWAKSYASKDPEGFRKFMEQAPAIAAAPSSGGADGTASSAPPAGAGKGLSDVEKAACRIFGTSEEEYIKARAAREKEDA